MSPTRSSLLTGTLLAVALLVAVSATHPCVSAHNQNRVDRHKANSRHFPEYANRSKLTRESPRVVSLVPLAGTAAEPASLFTLLREIGCLADAVVIGTPVSTSAALTAERTFVFTEYDVVVDDVVKNNEHDSVFPGDHLVVNRPGGEVRRDAVTLSAEDLRFKPLRIGAPHLLSLEWISDTHSYVTRRGTSVRRVVSYRATDFLRTLVNGLLAPHWKPGGCVLTVFTDLSTPVERSENASSVNRTRMWDGRRPTHFSRTNIS
jgi:hypothetical protein